MAIVCLCDAITLAGTAQDPHKRNKIRIALILSVNMDDIHKGISKAAESCTRCNHDDEVRVIDIRYSGVVWGLSSAFLPEYMFEFP